MCQLSLGHHRNSHLIAIKIGTGQLWKKDEKSLIQACLKLR